MTADTGWSWGAEGAQRWCGSRRVEMHDETLRDGLQSASAREPSVEARVELLEHMVRVGIESANIGVPAASQRHLHEAVQVARAVAHLPLALTCAARTMTADVAALVEVSQRAGVPLEAALFLGSSPLRAWVEGWDLDWLRARAGEAIRFARGHGLRVCFVTEDTTRSPPSWLEPLFETALESGASRLCLCDTVGHATPDGVTALVGFTRSLLGSWGRSGVLLDWHGHNDRGLALTNAVAAVRAGVDRVHATALGVGERTGNPCMELLLENLRPVTTESERAARSRYAEMAARALDVSDVAGAPRSQAPAPR